MISKVLFAIISSAILVITSFYLLSKFFIENKMTKDDIERLNINSKTPEYQIYKSPNLPSVHTLSNDCKNLAENLSNSIDKNNYCHTISECSTLPYWGYPLGFNNIINNHEYEKSMKLVNTFETQKEIWKCQLPMYGLLALSNLTIVCKNQKCKYEETYPKLPSYKSIKMELKK